MMEPCIKVFLSAYVET